MLLECTEVLIIQDSGASYDFIHSDDDPTPDPPNSMSDNGHGTACAGEVGMVKESACGVGVAYNSRIAGKINIARVVATVMFER